MPGKIKGAFNDEQFEAFCAELRGLPAKERTLEGIAALFAERTGQKASIMAAKSFKDGPFARYLEKVESGAKMREALVHAAGAGVHPLDAIEEAAILELQDHLTNADGGEVDVSWLASQLMKLRTVLSMRAETERKAKELELKIAESEQKVALAEQKRLIAEQTVKKLEEAARERADKNAQAKAALESAKKKGGLTQESLAKIEEAAKLL